MSKREDLVQRFSFDTMNKLLFFLLFMATGIINIYGQVMRFENIEGAYDIITNRESSSNPYTQKIQKYSKSERLYFALSNGTRNDAESQTMLVNTSRFYIIYPNGVLSNHPASYIDIPKEYVVKDFELIGDTVFFCGQKNGNQGFIAYMSIQELYTTDNYNNNTCKYSVIPTTTTINKLKVYYENGKKVVVGIGSRIYQSNLIISPIFGGPNVYPPPELHDCYVKYTVLESQVGVTGLPNMTLTCNIFKLYQCRETTDEKELKDIIIQGIPENVHYTIDEIIALNYDIRNPFYDLDGNKLSQKIDYYLDIQTHNSLSIIGSNQQRIGIYNPQLEAITDLFYVDYLGNRYTNTSKISSVIAYTLFSETIGQHPYYYENRVSNFLNWSGMQWIAPHNIIYKGQSNFLIRDMQYLKENNKLLLLQQMSTNENTIDDVVYYLDMNPLAFNVPNNIFGLIMNDYYRGIPFTYQAPIIRIPYSAYSTNPISQPSNNDPTTPLPWNNLIKSKQCFSLMGCVYNPRGDNYDIALYDKKLNVFDNNSSCNNINYSTIIQDLNEEISFENGSSSDLIECNFYRTNNIVEPPSIEVKTMKLPTFVISNGEIKCTNE